VSEEWKDLYYKGQPTHYKISNLGRFSSGEFRQIVSSGTYIIHGRINKMNGYRYIPLKINGKKYRVTAHSLVAYNFIGERPKGAQVNHKDGNKLNNAVSNLEYCTPSENLLHSSAIGLRRKINKRLGRETAQEIRSQYPAKSMNELAREYGVVAATILNIVRGTSYSPQQKEEI